MNQNQKIESFLKTGHPLTAISALNMFGCFRLAARINDLKKAGLNIEQETVTQNGKRFSQYRMGK